MMRDISDTSMLPPDTTKTTFFPFSPATWP
jgi:hypothetical protein